MLLTRDPLITMTIADGPDLATITVVNDWAVVHIGHHNDAEREIAASIAERHRSQRQSRHEGST
jgi:hypothetical protein